MGIFVKRWRKLDESLRAKAMQVFIMAEKNKVLGN
jgi:hypothetical protein